jgi:Peptide arylation enzymes
LQAIQEWGSNSALASLQRIQVGGAKLGETLAARIQREIGCQLQQVFGMAEGLVNYTRFGDDEQTILTTQGRRFRKMTKCGWPTRTAIRCRQARWVV